MNFQNTIKVFAAIGLFMLVGVMSMPISSQVRGGADKKAGPASASAPAETYDPTGKLGKDTFVVAMAEDARGCIWIGTEDKGAFRYDPSAAAGSEWTQFTIKDGLGDDNAYAVACDKQGRIWVGHLNHGVSVYNGQSWKNYDVLDGPLGERVFDIAVCPTDGDVWMATSAGLSRYSIKDDSWSYFTRADGLPSDQANAIAFDRAGNIIVGTQCDGVAMGTAASAYKQWGVLQAPERFGKDNVSPVPLAARGKGLPSNLINDVMVDSFGTIWVGTTAGLAYSRDGGKSWEFIRGRDCQAKADGLLGGKPDDWSTVSTTELDKLLPEDRVVSLAQDAAGYIWLGHWREGYTVINPKTLEVKYNNIKANIECRNKLGQDYVIAMLPRNDGPMWLGLYSGQSLARAAVWFPGANQPTKTAATPAPTTSAPTEFAKLPSGAKPPTVQELEAMTAKAKSATAAWPAPGAVYYADDWTTQGNWVGRYGRLRTMLCAVGTAPRLNHEFVQDFKILVEGRMGLNCTPDDSLRHWVHDVVTDNPKALYDLEIAIRRQAEWDDHGEDYQFTQDGPDIWVKVEVPDGVHRVSMYFRNPNGHVRKCRDMLIELKQFNEDIKKVQNSPVSLARARVNFFWGGVYKQFTIAGPAKYYIRIARNGGYNTICSGVFVDRPGKNGNELGDDKGVLMWCYDVPYLPPDISKILNKPSTISDFEPNARAAIGLWDATMASCKSKNIGGIEYERIAYRAAIASTVHPLILENWRWQMKLWYPSDRETFVKTMALAWNHMQSMNPLLRLKANRKYSPHTYETAEEWEQKEKLMK